MTDYGKSDAFKAVQEEVLKLLEDLPNIPEALLREKLLLIESITRHQVDVRSVHEK